MNGTMALPGDRVGVVVLLCDEPEVDARLLAVQQEIQEPLDEALGCLEQLIEQTGGRRNEASRGAVERGLGAVARARKWSDELTAALRGRPGNVSADATLDPVRVLRQAAVRDGDTSMELLAVYEARQLLFTQGRPLC